VACLTLVPGKADFLGNIYAFGAMLSFTIAHLSVIRLRMVEPERQRPYRGPGALRLGDRELPLFAVVGGLGTLLAFVTVTALHVEVAAAGVGWLLVGMAVYVLFRHRQGLDLVSTVRVTTPRPAVETEAEYQSILVAFDERGYVPDLIATAARLAARRRRGIHVLVTISVPASSPIDAVLPEQEAAAQSIIEQAKVQAGRRVSGRWEKVRAGQTGRRIVNEARAMKAEAIVMPMSPDGFGRALQTVLRERPCRVIVESIPEPVRRRSRAATR
jgi:APA family basic amino acid/polyamine antiporter